MKHIPNLLSIGRLVLTPYILLLLWRREWKLALVLCFVAGISDALDGFIARRFDAGSRLGAYLDPVSDKVLLGGIYLTLALNGTIGMWLALMVFGRDLFILLMVAAGWLLMSVKEFPPSIWGKASTAAQIAFILFLLLQLNGVADGPLVIGLKWLVAGLAVWSGLDYAWRAIGIARRTKPQYAA